MSADAGNCVINGVQVHRWELKPIAYCSQTVRSRNMMCPSCKSMTHINVVMWMIDGLKFFQFYANLSCAHLNWFERNAVLLYYWDSYVFFPNLSTNLEKEVDTPTVINKNCWTCERFKALFQNNFQNVHTLHSDKKPFVSQRITEMGYRYQ